MARFSTGWSDPRSLYGDADIPDPVRYAAVPVVTLLGETWDIYDYRANARIAFNLTKEEADAFIKLLE